MDRRRFFTGILAIAVVPATPAITKAIGKIQAAIARLGETISRRPFDIDWSKVEWHPDPWSTTKGDGYKTAKDTVESPVWGKSATYHLSPRV